MSRVGKLPVKVPENIKVAVDKNSLTFDSGKVKKTYTVSNGVEIDYKEGAVKLSAAKNAPSNISMFVGMDRSNIKNIV
ncbi:MAG: hypothetical protein FJ368_03700, partial [Pelagibacterales bacterium]|nr:hypothetical protein [Pelagibacterales bacterium]